MTSFVSCVHGHANLSCPNPSWFFLAFPKDPPWLWWILCNLAQLLPASLLGFLWYHLLLKPMTHASFCASFFFLRPNTLLFSIHGPGSSILYFLEGQAFLTFKGLIPYCNFEPQHLVSLNAQEKKWDDQATKTKRNKPWSQL